MSLKPRLSEAMVKVVYAPMAVWARTRKAKGV
jgi:hypothetical protein